MEKSLQSKELKQNKKQLNKLRKLLIQYGENAVDEEIDWINEEKTCAVVNTAVNISLIKELKSCLKEYEELKK